MIIPMVYLHFYYTKKRDVLQAAIYEDIPFFTL